MIVSADRIVWQPFGIYQERHDFGVYFDRRFIKEMMKARPDSKILKNMNDRGTELLRRIGHTWSNPYQFYQDSALVTQFDLGENGTWLVVSETYGRSPLEVYPEPKLIPYYSHNVDTPRQVESLLALVDMWTEYSEILTGKDK